ncbi:hypothetical protein DAPPUDRAFT_321588 [Daphnia pulex]|uniref:Uncharacterized protein n=1 Tax=Daphnia pulex TaxID=6669 RepID=E9GT37_DAPPU|nr:hypothetical protein DAPPUDRAFT_321588 [Daphnia pulex]|eukprot:EFX77301.1 hypothetical protein DAPPUDRAFT_321588 [Daphnia pulex]
MEKEYINGIKQGIDDEVKENMVNLALRIRKAYGLWVKTPGFIADVIKNCRFLTELKKLDAIAKEGDYVFIKAAGTYAVAVENFPDKETFREMVPEALTPG